MYKALIIVALVGGIFGYGYWHAATHASFHVQLDFAAVKGEKSRSIPKTEVNFLDAEEQILAIGKSDEHYGYLKLIHPEVGDCYEKEKAAASSKGARNAWQKCFEHLSTWISRWADEVRGINLKTPECFQQKMPVSLSRAAPDWYLWWVPLPHVGGKPYSYYSLTISIDEQNCEIESGR